MRTTLILAILAATGLSFQPTAAAAQEHGRHGDQGAPAPCTEDIDRAPMSGGMMGMRGGMMGMMGMMEPGEDGPMAGHGSEMMSPGMMLAETGVPSPGMLLGQKDALDLSDDQVRRLQELGRELSEARSEHMTTMREVHGELAELGGDEADRIDVSRYESLLRKMAETAVAMHVREARVRNEAAGVLTAQQRSNVRYGLELLRGMRREMGGGHMPEDRGGPPGGARHGGN